jgi:hypothetical protein
MKDLLGADREMVQANGGSEREELIYTVSIKYQKLPTWSRAVGISSRRVYDHCRRSTESGPD